MQPSLENPFRNPTRRATKRLFKGEDRQKNISTKYTKEKLANKMELTLVKYGPHEIFYPQVLVLKQVEKLIPKEVIKRQGESARQIIAERIIVKNGNIVKAVLEDLGLITLPSEIGSLIYLQEFSCRVNQLKKLPKEIGRLTKLQVFDCCHNKLSEFPAEISQLINLQKFKCWDNGLNRAEIEKLEKLLVKGCKLEF